MRNSLVLCAMLGLLTALPTLGQDKQQDQRRRPQQPAFRFLFSVLGVEFSADQQAKVDELREKYTPQLVEVQNKQGSVYSAEQRQARQEAFRAARDAGKEGQEAREAVDAALKLTDEQRKQLETLRKEQADLFAKIQGEVRALLTEGQRARPERGQRNRNAESRPAAIAPTHRDRKYGPHGRNVMDVWLAKSDKPTPVLVSIHGGGFRGGNKSVSAGILRECLE